MEAGLNDGKVDMKYEYDRLFFELDCEFIFVFGPFSFSKYKTCEFKFETEIST